jgi:ABC-2 type transport system ATP-binding protein
MIAHIENLTIKYDDFTAVRQLNLSINEGDIFGFIGPNGAGKTSTIRVMATLLLPAEGRVLIDGVDVEKYPDRVKPLIGYMPDFFGVYDNLKVWEYLEFFARVYGIAHASISSMLDSALEITKLEGKKHSYVEDLSRGMKQRLCLAKTLIHDPKLLILDEPASGMDPNARMEIRELLKSLSSSGKTIFISSHILSELADICNRVGIIELGKLVDEGTIEEMSKRVQPARLLRIRVRNKEASLKILETIETVISFEEKKDYMVVRSEDSDDAAETIIKALVAADVGLLSAAEEKPGLEDLFKEITRGMVI